MSKRPRLKRFHSRNESGGALTSFMTGGADSLDRYSMNGCKQKRRFFAHIMPESESGYVCSKLNREFFSNRDNADGRDGSGSPEGSNRGVHRNHGHTGKGNPRRAVG